MRNGYCTQVPGAVLQMDWSCDSKYIRVAIKLFLNILKRLNIFIQVGTGEFKYIVYEAPSGNENKDSAKIVNIVWDQWSRYKIVKIF